MAAGGRGRAGDGGRGGHRGKGRQRRDMPHGFRRQRQLLLALVVGLGWQARRPRPQPRIRRQHVVVAGDGDRELLDQRSQLADFAGHGLDAVGAGGIRRHHLALDGGEAAAELGDLAGEVGGAARQVRDLAADVGAIAQPHRDGVVEDQEGQRGERHDRGFRSADAGHRIQDQAEGCCDQHHADGDENRGNADHVARKALKSSCPQPRRTPRTSPPALPRALQP